MIPHQLTDEEVRTKLLVHIWDMIAYWKDPGRTTNPVEGIAFSILAALDGDSPELPGFQIIPHPHPSDREYLKGEGENWFPESKDYEHDIGPLHEFFHSAKPQEIKR